MKIFNYRYQIMVCSLLVFSASSAIAGETAAEKIARAQSAAPAAISAEATIMDSNGSLLQEGSNGWTCTPDTMAGDKAPMCNDALWMEMMHAVMTQAPFETDSIGYSYMLQGDIGAGVSNSNPYHPDPKNAADYVETGPHVMVIVPKAMLEGMNDDPTTGGPYVMWKDTPYAHVMWPVSQ